MVRRMLTTSEGVELKTRTDRYGQMLLNSQYGLEQTRKTLLKCYEKKLKESKRAEGRPLHQFIKTAERGEP